MRFFRVAGLILLLLLVLLLVSAAFIKKDFTYVRDITITAPQSVVWNNISVFKNHDKWSQWRKIDPKMQVTYSGTDAMPGSSMTWKSAHKDVGNGSQYMVSVSMDKRIDTRLDFDGRGKAESFMEMSGDSSSCKVSWGIQMHADYPMNAVFALMMRDEDMFGMLDTGLNMLKTLCERER